MAPSFWQIAIVLLLVVMLFGRGKISELMGDVARGIKSFKKGMQDTDAQADQGAHRDAIGMKSEPVVNKHDETVKS